MSFLYQQIGLNFDDNRSRVNAHMIINQISIRLRDYGDNGPIDVIGPGRFVALADTKRGKDMVAVLEVLAKHEIILYKTTDNPLHRKSSAAEPIKVHAVFVTNRYKLERLREESKWLATQEARRGEAPTVNNLVYYNPLTGKGSVNGKPIHLKKSKPSNKLKPKEIFDLLCTYAPNPVPRERLTTTMRLGKDTPDESDRLSQALSNLRRRCGVTSEVISVRTSGVLNATVIPVDKLPDSFIFPE